MWIDENTSFSPVIDENGEYSYPYNDKEFTVTVNVYANAKVVTEEDIENEKKAEISNLTVAGTELTKVENQDYDYETSLPEGTTSTTINIETISPYATVNVERIDSLAYKKSNIKRLSTQKILELLPGDNYFKITVVSENNEIENKYKLSIKVGQTGTLLTDAIFNKYKTIYENPTLTTSSNNTTDADGLYKSIATNDGKPTYYFRGNVQNYVDFAGFTWRVVRINEDGTIRIVMQDGINDNTNYKFNSISEANKDNMYYSNSDIAKPKLDAWYSSKIANNLNYSNKIATGDYYCEQAKIAAGTTAVANSGGDMILYSNYTKPDFKCEDDINGYGLVNASIGLLSYDEVLHAGGYYNGSNNSYYLYNDYYYWMMSPAGIASSDVYDWYVNNYGSIFYTPVHYNGGYLRPVINLKPDVTVTGTGASDDHWVIQ